MRMYVCVGTLSPRAFAAGCSYLKSEFTAKSMKAVVVVVGVGGRAV